MKPATILLILGMLAPLHAGAQDLASLEQMRQAAARGSDAAQLEMGILYEFGYNMPKNDINALAWYQLSADQGNALAAKRRDLLKARMSPEAIEAAQKLSQELVVAGPPMTPVPATNESPPPAEAAAPATPAETSLPAAEPSTDKPVSTP
ncbi:MAG: hypothetical protein OEY27_04155 [Gammaproteobacteria bacterium]|nr:hypothetical protein [Gammaproteobacteria bacterium]